MELLPSYLTRDILRIVGLEKPPIEYFLREGRGSYQLMISKQRSNVTGEVCGRYAQGTRKSNGAQKSNGAAASAFNVHAVGSKSSGAKQCDAPQNK